MIDEVKGGSEMGAKPDGRNRGVSQRACAQCGTALRRGNPGTLCEPCSRRRPDIAQRLRESGFFTLESVRTALAVYDFGLVFRAARRTTELTQAQLGALLELEQDRISRIERGQRPLQDIATVARIATRLGIPPVLLGFDPDATTVESSQAGESELEADWVRRRDFSFTAAGILLGLGITGVDVERLAALLPTEPALSPRRIGMADVAALEQATELARGLIFSHGSGLFRSATVAQLRSVLPLLDAACTEHARERLKVATVDLGTVAAWASYDAGHHHDARRLFLLALSIAGQAEHPQAGDLTAYLLMDMAHQSLHLHQPQDALNLIQLGSGTPRRRQPLPASTSSYLSSYQAWSYGARAGFR